jgi:hypothetical protein
VIIQYRALLDTNMWMGFGYSMDGATQVGCPDSHRSFELGPCKLKSALFSMIAFCGAHCRQALHDSLQTGSHPVTGLMRVIVCCTVHHGR